MTPPWVTSSDPRALRRKPSLVGGTLTLYLFGTYVLMTTQTKVRRPRTWAFALGLVGALPVLLWPAELVSLAGELATSLFPRVPQGPGGR